MTCSCDPMFKCSLRKGTHMCYNPSPDTADAYTGSVERTMELTMLACDIPLLVTAVDKPRTKKEAKELREEQLRADLVTIDTSSAAFASLKKDMDILCGFHASRTLTGNTLKLYDHMAATHSAFHSAAHSAFHFATHSATQIRPQQ